MNDILATIYSVIPVLIFILGYYLGSHRYEAPTNLKEQVSKAVKKVKPVKKGRILHRSNDDLYQMQQDRIKNIDI